MKLAYLASPFAHKERFVRDHRVAAASLCATLLMDREFAVHSPLSHNVPLLPFFEKEPAHDFWMRQDIAVLERCDLLVLLPLDGWRQSKGVAEELAFAKAHRQPILVWQDLHSMLPYMVENLSDRELTDNQWGVIL